MSSGDPSPNPVAFADLPDARTCFGRGTEAWSTAGRLQVEEDWWVALSGTPHVDYYLVLLYGTTSPDVAPGLIDEISAAKIPSLIMLAGAGLGGVGALRDAGWVCTGAMPFMARTGGPAFDDPAVRRIQIPEMPEARALAAAAFGVPTEVGDHRLRRRRHRPERLPDLGIVRRRRTQVLLPRNVGEEPLQRRMGPVHGAGQPAVRVRAAPSSGQHVPPAPRRRSAGGAADGHTGGRAALPRGRKCDP